MRLPVARVLGVSNLPITSLEENTHSWASGVNNDPKPRGSSGVLSDLSNDLLVGLVLDFSFDLLRFLPRIRSFICLRFTLRRLLFTFLVLVVTDDLPTAPRLRLRLLSALGKTFKGATHILRAHFRLDRDGDTASLCAKTRARFPTHLRKHARTK